ncbi:MAG: virulence protein E [Bacteroidales bacterium]|nr:virulence protein E [Bacteroidales bacterium]
MMKTMNNATIALARIQCFSMFSRPITNKRPYITVNIKDIYNYITSDIAKDETLEYRSITDEKARREFKAKHFDYCTFSGTFKVREDKSIIQHSGLICLDFDHLKDVEGIFNELKHDQYFDTLLLFRSPSGDGLKWVISFIDSFQRYGNDRETHAEYQIRFFASLYNYIFNHYDVEVDRHCRNLSRACFLPYDPDAYINPLLL